MKKLYLFLGLIAVYSVLAIAMNNKIAREKLEGKWNVKVASAPYGYQNYVFDIKEDKGEYKVDFHFVDSRFMIIDQSLTMDDGKLTGSVTVDGEMIEITIWKDRGIVQGTARSPNVGTLPMTFTRPRD